MGVDAQLAQARFYMKPWMDSCIAFPTRIFHLPLMQTAVGTGEDLGNSPTLCRMERCAQCADIVALKRMRLLMIDAAITRYGWGLAVYHFASRKSLADDDI